MLSWFKIRRRWILDALSLGAVLQYVAFRFLQSTMFILYYSHTYKLITMGLLLLFGGVRYAYLIIKTWREKEDRRAKIRFGLNVGIAWMLAFPFFFVGWVHDYKVLVFLPVCCMCLYNMEVEKVLKSFCVTVGILLISTVMCCLAGTVRNLTWDNIAAYGIINSTDFATYGLFLLITAWCGMKHNEWKTMVFFMLLTITASCILYRLTESRTLVYCSGLLLICILWECLYSHKFRRSIRLNAVSRCINSLSAVAFPLIGVLVLILTVLYSKHEPWAMQVNQLLTRRLEVVMTPYEKYGINPFGADIKSLHGNGGTTIPAWNMNGYGYIDVAYAMLAIKYGWVITGIVAGLWIWFTVKALRARRERIALAMLILAAHGFSEARILDVNYNIFLVLPFCLIKREDTDIEYLQEDKVPIVTICSLIAGFVGLYIICPKLLSWLRTFFYLEGWSGGLAGINSLIFTIFIFFSLWAIWKNANNLLTEDNTNKAGFKRILSILVFVIAIAICTTMVDKRINRGILDNEDRLKKEEPIIHKVQELAKLPVYAAELSELYQRQFGGFRDHVFSSEQLSFPNQGTLFTDSSVDAPGYYLQVSDQTAIHTTDQAVVDGLANEGYSWLNFNNAKHVIDLADTAVFNGRNPSEPMVVKCGEKIRTVNCQTDQYYGWYEVQFTLSLLDKLDEGDICKLEVLGEAGDWVILTETITSKDFGNSGMCEKTLKYMIGDTPKVLYGIEVTGGASIIVNSIIWQKVSETDEFE